MSGSLETTITVSPSGTTVRSANYIAVRAWARSAALHGAYFPTSLYHETTHDMDPMSRLPKWYFTDLYDAVERAIASAMSTHQIRWEEDDSDVLDDPEMDPKMPVILTVPGRRTRCVGLQWRTSVKTEVRQTPRGNWMASVTGGIGPHERERELVLGAIGDSRVTFGADSLTIHDLARIIGATVEGEGIRIDGQWFPVR